MQYTKVNTIKNTFSPKIYQNLCVSCKFDSLRQIRHAKQNAYNFVDILGHRPWPDIVTIYF